MFLSHRRKSKPQLLTMELPGLRLRTVKSISQEIRCKHFSLSLRQSLSSKVYGTLTIFKRHLHFFKNPLYFIQTFFSFTSLPFTSLHFTRHYTRATFLVRSVNKFLDGQYRLHEVWSVLNHSDVSRYHNLIRVSLN